MTLRAIIAKWLAAPMQIADDAVETGAPDALNISEATLWEAERYGTPVVSPQATFSRPPPLAHTLPDNMALDQLPTTQPFTAWAAQSMYHEGIGFLGYAYLAQLAQRAEYRRMAEIRAEHATRKWIELKGADDEKLAEIAAEMDRLGVKDLFETALKKDALFGRYQIFLDFGDWDDEAELNAGLPIDKGKINPDRPLKAIRGVEPIWSYPGPYDSANPLSPGFYRPAHWYVYGRTIEDGHLLTFVGREVPDMLKPAYAFGGLSLTQMAKPYVDNWLRTRQSISDLVNAFAQMVLKTNLSSVLSAVAGAAKSLFRRVDLFNKTRSNRGTMVIDKATEDLTNVTTPLSGLDKLQAQAQEHMSSVSGIPLVILLGVTPAGLNASSDGEVRSFYADIKSNEQEHTCRPHLTKLIQIIQLSLYGEIDPKIVFEFRDLWEMSEKDKATLRKADAETAKIYCDIGAIDNEEVRDRLANEEGGMYRGLTGPAPEVEDDEPDDKPKPD